MTKTAAYNANEVAAVYMSLNRDDLLSTDEGGNKLSGEESLKNGFFGLSDPMNLRGLLETFEYGVVMGEKSRPTYKIRILNPTTELEDTLIGFYEKVFPSNSSIFAGFRDASLRDANMTSVEGNSSFLAPTPPMPVIYLRWGYGTNSDSGLSRIHKAVLNDMKYFVSDRKDRTIEILATDQFTYSKINPDFNQRPHKARVHISEGVKGHTFLRKPSDIIAALFATYTATYPGCVPVIDLGDYEEALNNLVYSYAAALAEGDILSAQALIADREGVDLTSDSHEMEPLTPEELSQIEALLDRPLVTTDSIDRGAKGVVTPQILYQAFKGVFEQLGFKWDMNSVDSPEPVTGPISHDQTSSNVTPVGSSTTKTAGDQVSNANNAATDTTVDIQNRLLNAKVLPQYTTVSPPATKNMLSFWPMALDSGKIRPLTTSEKNTAAMNGTAPLWVNAGMVNLNNYKVGEYKDDNKSFKYSFPLNDLQAQFNTDDIIKAATNFEADVGLPSYIKPIAVSIPVTTVDSLDPLALNQVWVGNKTSPVLIGTSIIGHSIDRCVPLLDLATASLYPVSEWVQLPGEEFTAWASYARGTQAIQGDPQFDGPFKSERADNPPLVFLEPTWQTALWVSKSTANYHTQQEAKLSAETSDALFGDFAAMGVDIQLPPSTSPQKSINLSDRYGNASVTMSDDGELPDITRHLYRIINNINRTIIGKDSKLTLQQVQVGMIYEHERDLLSDKSIALAGFSWKEPWVEKNSSILFISPSKTLKSDLSDHLVRPILSFPQTFSPSAGNSVIWLDYGTPNSIVAKVEFTGDTRVLTNIKQSNFDVRQFADVKALFDGNSTLSENTLTNVISDLLASKIKILAGQTVVGAQLDARDLEIKRLTEANNRIVNTRADDGRYSQCRGFVRITRDILGANKLLPNR